MSFSEYRGSEEAAAQYIQNRLGGLVNTDNLTYDEVNLNRYSKLQDNDNAGPLDMKAKLFTNSDGKAKLTTQGVDKTNMDAAADWYDFDKREFTNAGRNFYTKQMQNASEDEKNAHLTQVENELKMALNDDYKKRKKTDPNAVQNNLIATPDIDRGEDSSKPDKEANIYELQSELKKLQKTDSILQRLSLRNLKYPIDADYGNTQDYVQIDQFTYQAVNPQIVFPQKEDPNEGAFSAGFRQGTNIMLDGLDRTSPKNITIGNVRLPMPNQLNDSNNVAWGEDQLNSLTAAAATIGAGGLQQGIDFFDDIRQGKVKGFDILGKILGGLGDTGKGLVGFLEQAKTEKNTNLMARSVVGSSLLNLAGFGLSPEAILARGAGVIPNANLELLFNAPALRAFRFDWKMSPRSQEEAIRINNIIRFFKQGMAAKKMSLSGVPDSYFLGTPNIFDISFKTSKTNREITNTNHSVLRIKTCACVGAAVNYTPQGMWNAYEKGQPTSCILSLQFKELEPIYNTDYEEDPFEYDNMIGAVPADAVGY